eukprot:TRINITY_DN22463_c0_g1_i1.p1 TRINITY_DN22463_c0_g1~~TRINITY_DN22463_c0_g1_i1.p1  ORF type:complete len:372 (+),score=116.02 TRINITY_DN22463_c0_g1_i1:58-1173(+)
MAAKRSPPRKVQRNEGGQVLIGGGKGVNHNEELCRLLLEMGKMEKAGGQLFKWKAYRTAADSLAALDHRVKSGAEARALPGIGAKIAAKIEQILETGQLRQLEEKKDDPIVKALATFTGVSGIGPVNARKYVDKGYRTLDDILQAKEPLTEHQRIGIKHYDDLLVKIPREEVTALGAVVRAAAQAIDVRLLVSTCGSHRRGLAELGDVDCLLTHPKSSSTSGENYVYLRKLTAALQAQGVVIDVISEGLTKMMGVCRLPDGSTPPHDAAAEPAAKRQKRGPAPAHRARRIDIRWVAADCFPTALLYFTGSAVFNATLRAHALQQGYSLSEYGLHRVAPGGKAKGERVPVASERAVFETLNVKYVAPHERCM